MKKAKRNAAISALVLCFYLTTVYPQNRQYHLPVFRIALTDSSYYGTENVKLVSPLMFVYFLPDCDDCKNFTKCLIAHLQAFRNIQIIMITKQSLTEVKKFQKEFNLKKYKNIIVGTEGYTQVFQRQFQIEKFPFIALFNSRRQLIKKYDHNNLSPNDLVDSIEHAYNLKKR